MPLAHYKPLPTAFPLPGGKGSSPLAVIMIDEIQNHRLFGGPQRRRPPLRWQYPGFNARVLLGTGHRP